MNWNDPVEERQPSPALVPERHAARGLSRRQSVDWPFLHRYAHGLRSHEGYTVMLTCVLMLKTLGDAVATRTACRTVQIRVNEAVTKVIVVRTSSIGSGIMIAAFISHLQPKRANWVHQKLLENKTRFPR